MALLRHSPTASLSRSPLVWAVLVGTLGSALYSGMSIAQNAWLTAMAPLALLITAIWPFFPLLITVAVLPFEGTASWLGEFSGYKLLGVLAVGGMVWDALRHGWRLRFDRQTLFMTAFVLFGLFSFFWTQSPFTWARRATILIEVCLFYFVALAMVNSFKRLDLMIKVMIFSTLASAIEGLLSAFGARAGLRISGGAGDPNIFAAALTPIIPLLIGYLLVQRRAGLRLIWATMILVIVGAIFMSGSRNGLYALILTGFIAILLFRKVTVLSVVMIVTAFVGGLGFFAKTPSFLLERYSINEVIEDRGTSRLDIWMVGAQMILRNPIVGVGSGAFNNAFPSYYPQVAGIVRPPLSPAPSPHSLYVGLLAENGLVGGSLFVVAIIEAFRKMRSARRRIDQEGIRVTALARQETILIGLQVSLISYLLLGIGLTTEYSKFLWLLLGIISASVQMPMEIVSSQDKAVMFQRSNLP